MAHKTGPLCSRWCIYNEVPKSDIWLKIDNLDCIFFESGIWEKVLAEDALYTKTFPWWLLHFSLVCIQDVLPIRDDIKR